MILDKSEDHQPFDQRRDIRLEKKDILRSKCKNYAFVNHTIPQNYNAHSIVLYVPLLESSYIDYVLRRCHCRSTVPCSAFYCVVRTEVVKYNGDFPSSSVIPPGPLSNSQMQILMEDALFLATPIKNPSNFHAEYSFQNEHGVDPLLLSIPVQYQRHDNTAIQKLAETIQIFASLKLPRHRTKSDIGCFLLGQCATVRGGVSLLTSRSLLLKAAGLCTVKYSVKLNLAPGASTSFASCSEHAFNPKVCLFCYVQSTQKNNPHCVNPVCRSHSYQLQNWVKARPAFSIDNVDLSSPPPSSPSGSNSPNAPRTYVEAAAQSGRSSSAKTKPHLTPIGNGLKPPNNSRNLSDPFLPPYVTTTQVQQTSPIEPNERIQRNIDKLGETHRNMLKDVQNLTIQLNRLSDTSVRGSEFQEMYEGMERRVECLEAQHKEDINAFEQGNPRPNQTKRKFEGLKKDLCKLIDDRNAQHSSELEQIHRKVHQLELKTDRSPAKCTCTCSRQSSIVDAESDQSDGQTKPEGNIPGSNAQTNAPKPPPPASTTDPVKSMPDPHLNSSK